MLEKDTKIESDTNKLIFKEGTNKIKELYKGAAKEKFPSDVDPSSVFELT